MDATHEAVAIVPERAMGGHQLTRILDQLATTRGLPKAIRTDNGKEFCGRAMLNWAHARGVQLFLIEPGKPNQNAYIESFNGRFREECLKRTLVHQPGTCPRDRRSLAAGVQRGATQEVPRRTDPGDPCSKADAKTVKLTPDSKVQCY